MQTLHRRILKPYHLLAQPSCRLPTLNLSLSILADDELFLRPSSHNLQVTSMGMQPFGPCFVPHQDAWLPQAPQIVGHGVQWAPRPHAPPAAGTMQPPPPLQRQFPGPQPGKLFHPPPPPSIRQLPGGSEAYLSSQSGNSPNGDMSPHVPPQPSAPSSAQQKGSFPPSEGLLRRRLNTAPINTKSRKPRNAGPSYKRGHFPASDGFSHAY